MSRKSFHVGNYEFVTGVDHVFSTFVQIFDRSIPEDKNEYGLPILDIDNSGCRVYADRLGVALPLVLARVVRSIKRSYEITSRKVDHPHMGVSHVLELAHAIGLHVDREIFDLLD